MGRGVHGEGADVEKDHSCEKACGREVGACCWSRRKRVAMVGQEPVLYGRSIMDNIRFGIEEDEEGYPSREEVEEVRECRSDLSERHIEECDRMWIGTPTNGNQASVSAGGGKISAFSLARPQSPQERFRVVSSDPR